MYNDYYLQSIDGKMSANNTLLNQIIQNQNSINDNIATLQKTYFYTFCWLFMFIVAIFIYHYIHTIFIHKGG